jgi:hypothetical protein
MGAAPGLPVGQVLNQLGLILQFIGIFIVFPELIRREDAQKWEHWFHKVGETGRKIEFSIRDLIWISPAAWLEIDGIRGLINLITRGINFYFLGIVTTPLDYWNLIRGTTFDKIILAGPPIIIVYSWLLLTLIYYFRKYRLKRESSKGLLLAYGVLNLFMIGGWLFFYVPVGLLTLVILISLRGIAQNSLEKILTRATFPFILFGTLFELIAAFI